MELPGTPSGPTAWQAPDPATRRVLVVDDEEEVRTLTARMLAAAGYRVITAAGPCRPSSWRRPELCD
jgi:PleD family two-component response regulator